MNGQEYKMEILGIGNAIVDVICKVDEDFIEVNNLTKGTMKLIFDEKEFKELLERLKLKRLFQVDQFKFDSRIISIRE